VHLGLLDAPHVRMCRGEGVADVEVPVLRLVLRRSCRNLAVLDVDGDLRRGEDRAGINTGLLRQLAYGCADECGVGRFQVAARLQNDPVRTVLDQQDLGVTLDIRADQKRTRSHMHRKGPPRGKIPSLREQSQRLGQQGGLVWITLDVCGNRTRYIQITDRHEPPPHRPKRPAPRDLLLACEQRDATQATP
jgi:hypothetical protein